MNNELKKSLNRDTDNNLFYLFKHDGSIDFERKIVAGVILNQRGYNKYNLRKEREKIVAELNKKVDEYSKPMKQADKHRRDIRNSIIAAAITAVVYPIINILLQYFDTEKPFINTSTIAVLLMFAVMLTYRIFTRSKELKKLMNSDLKDLKIYKSRIAAIDQNWNF